MPNVDSTAQRAFATEVVAQLRAAGFDAYWAGGCVRDQLLGRRPKDYDVATSALPDQIRDLFGRRRTLALGAAFGVITVLGPKLAGQIEVATFRRDAGYSDGRHPDAVVFSTPAEDARRRDFTINGMFYDPHADAVIDFVGGQTDLAAGVVRAIGNASERFGEDKLRLLRAVRFAATFDFKLESDTRLAIAEMAGEIGAVSAERIAAELRLILVDGHRRRGVELLDELGLLAQILPELAATGRSAVAWQETLAALAALDAPSFPLALSALVRRFVPAGVVPELGRRLKLSNAETQTTAWLVAHADALASLLALAWPRLQRLLIADRIDDLMALWQATVQATGRHQAEVEYCRERLGLPAAELNPPALLSGDDLVVHGLTPGPEFQRLLEAVRDAQLEKRLNSKQEALALVDQIRQGGSNSG